MAMPQGVDPRGQSKRALFVAKLWFIGFYGSCGFIMPYFNLLLKHCGYGASELGLVSALRPFVAATCGPPWAAYADSIGAHRFIFISTFVISALIRFSIGFVAQPFWYAMMAVLAMEMFGSPVSIMGDTAIVAASTDDGDYGRCRFWACLAWGITGTLSGSMMHAFGDQMAFWVFGACSLLALAAAWALDFSFVGNPASRQVAEWDASQVEASTDEPLLPPFDTEESCTTCVPVRANTLDEPLLPLDEPLLPAVAPAVDKLAVKSDSSGSTCCSPAHARMQHQPDATEHRQGDQPSSTTAWEEAIQEGRTHHSHVAESFCARLARLLRSGAMVTFLTQALVMGVGAGVIDAYLFVYLDDLGASSSIMGACLAVICCIELPVFMFSGSILRALGYVTSLNISLGAICLRLAAYSVLNLVPSLWMVVPVEILHGITFGLSWTAGINYCKKMAPKGLEATAQGLFQSTYFGLGRGLGALVAGQLYEGIGPANMFRIMCLWTTAGWALTVIAQYYFSRRAAEVTA